MENIKDILASAGVEIEAEKLAEIEKGVLANYRSKAEADAKSAKVKELEAQLKDANEALETAKATDLTNAAEVEKMRERIAAYEQADKDRAAKADEAKARADFDAKLSDAIGDKAFTNDLVKQAVQNAAYALASANPDMDMNAVLSAVVGDSDGVWANPQQDVKKMPSGSTGSAAGTQSIQSLEDLKNMSVEDIRAHMAEVDKLLAAQK